MVSHLMQEQNLMKKIEKIYKKVEEQICLEIEILDILKVINIETNANY